MRSRSAGSGFAVCRNLLAALLLIGNAFPAPAQTLSGDLRYVASTSLANTVEATALYTRSLASWVDGEFAARAAFSSHDWERLDYKADGIVPVWDFFRVRARLAHSYRLAESTAVSTLLVSGELRASPVSFLDVFFRGGWYERFTLLSKALILPTPPRNDVHDHDFAALFGLEVRPAELIRLTLSAGTLDEIDVYNLDNPYLGASVAYRPPGERWSGIVYARYQILLGFGRLDDFLLGFALKWDLESGTPPSTGS